MSRMSGPRSTSRRRRASAHLQPEDVQPNNHLPNGHLNGQAMGGIWAQGSPNRNNNPRMQGAKTAQDCRADNLRKVVISRLTDSLSKYGCYETETGLQIRSEILKDLNKLVKGWIKSLTLSDDCTWSDASSFGGRIVTYGSYQLGVTHQGADIDALFIAPRFISRQKFFSSFVNYLRILSDEVTEVRAIEEAFVPLIKFRYNEIEIDLTFAQLRVDSVPASDEDLLREDLFNVTNMDQKCYRGLNGYRATILILKLVPDVGRFQVVLRAIKLWAQNQGIYGNILGYLGGFSWAVLVARICIDFPDLDEADLILKFFVRYHSWKWPTPVRLVDENQAHRHAEYVKANYSPSEFWSPDQNFPRKMEVMPILTPTYPYQNSTFNITCQSLGIICDIMGQAGVLCDRILKGQLSWDYLFETHHIFQEYDHFLVVVASAPLPGAFQCHQPFRQRMASPATQWFGLIESKIRLFVNHLEASHHELKFARIWPKPFSKRANTFSKKGRPREIDQQFWFIGLNFKSRGHFARDSHWNGSLEWFKHILLEQSQSFHKPDMKVEALQVFNHELPRRFSPMELKEMVSFQFHKVINRDQLWAPTSMARSIQTYNCSSKASSSSSSINSSSKASLPSSSKASSASSLASTSTWAKGKHWFGVGPASFCRENRSAKVRQIIPVKLLRTDQPAPPTVLLAKSSRFNNSEQVTQLRRHTMEDLLSKPTSLTKAMRQQRRPLPRFNEIEAQEGFVQDQGHPFSAEFNNQISNQLIGILSDYKRRHSACSSTSSSNSSSRPATSKKNHSGRVESVQGRSKTSPPDRYPSNVLHPHEPQPSCIAPKSGSAEYNPSTPKFIYSVPPPSIRPSATSGEGHPHIFNQGSELPIEIPDVRVPPPAVHPLPLHQVRINLASQANPKTITDQDSSKVISPDNGKTTERKNSKGL